jgi:hypothetical protein
MKGEDGEGEPYVQITSPLNWSTFKYDSTIPSAAQKIWLSFASNLTYDEIQRAINGQPFNEAFLSVFPGAYVVEVHLLKNREIISSDESRFHITE